MITYVCTLLPLVHFPLLNFHTCHHDVSREQAVTAGLCTHARVPLPTVASGDDKQLVYTTEEPGCFWLVNEGRMRLTAWRKVQNFPSHFKRQAELRDAVHSLCEISGSRSVLAASFKVDCQVLYACACIAVIEDLEAEDGYRPEEQYYSLDENICIQITEIVKRQTPIQDIISCDSVK
jgi:hypothetical protein